MNREVVAKRAPKGKYAVELSAAPNPDFWPGSFEAEVRIRPSWVVVRSLKEASMVARKFIRANELGGGNWTGGNVVDDAGVVVAHVSYNGRVWEGPGRGRPTREIKLAKELVGLAKELAAESADSERLTGREASASYSSDDMLAMMGRAVEGELAGVDADDEVLEAIGRGVGNAVESRLFDLKARMRGSTSPWAAEVFSAREVEKAKSAAKSVAKAVWADMGDDEYLDVKKLEALAERHARRFRRID